jgi:putative ABC transport system permease protein
LIRDARFALRILTKSPSFTLVAVLTLALGIAANSTVFSWISSTLLNPIPGLTHTANLVSIMRGERSDHPTPPFSYLDYRDLRENSHSFSGMLAYHDDFVSLTGAGKPERIYGALTSANYFDVLGLPFLLGRGFSPAEEQPGLGANVVVIGYSVWRNHFAQDPHVIGKTIQINQHPYTVIGVTPREFHGCKTGLSTDLWIPLMMDQPVWGSTRPGDRGTYWLQVLGKLRPGVTEQRAAAELNVLMQGIVERYPEDHSGSPNQITIDPLWRSPFGINVYLAKMLPMLLGLGLALLLLACANVANLLLVRSVARRREIAIRLSIGATRAQLVRQLMIESLLLGLAAGFAAIVITVGTSRSLAALIPPTTLPLTHNAHVDLRVLLATTAVSILTALIFGTLPALRSSSVPIQAVLKEEGGSVSVSVHKSRLSSGLVVAQIALSLLLLVCAGLFTRSLQKAEEENAGFDPNHILLVSYEPGPSGYNVSAAIAFDRQVLSKLAALPGVQDATLADFAPLSFSIHSDFVELQGYVPQPHESMEISRAYIGPNYFRTLHTSLISGRDVTDGDGPGSQRIAYVNQALADRYWPGQNPIGKRINDGVDFTVIGVVRNAKYRLLSYPPEPVFYLPMFQSYNSIYDTTIQLRVSGDPQAIAFPVEQAIHQLNPELPLFNVHPLTVTMRMGTVFQRAAVAFASSFGILAMLLAAVGIYGVVAYTTRQRTREIGIRMALGAERGQIFRLVLLQGLLLALVGLAVGVTLSLALTRLLKSQLYGVSTTDTVTFATVTLILCAVAMAACYIPAHRATKTDPNVALRYQ